MKARVHAIVVARPGASARAQLLHTLDALGAQTQKPDAVTLVFCGDAATARTSPTIAAVVEAIIEARAGLSFADAVALARPRVAEGASVWLLAHDTAPEADALEQLTGALERSPSAALAAPKLLDAVEDATIASLGVTMTRLGRSVELAAGEFDQGQHDGEDDALSADVRAVLIRGEVWPHLLPDPALAGADEGLDLGVRARLGGGRVVLTPAARVTVHPDGPAALPPGDAQRAYASRRAQLHRRLAYAPGVAVPLHWLSLLPLALWRSLAHLIGKRPVAVLPEWAAAVVALVSFAAVARARARIRSFRTASWASIAPLRVSYRSLRQRLDDGQGSERGAVSELDFFSGGGAWAVLGAGVVSIASFLSLLAFPALGGGGLQPLRDTVSALWQDAAWGVRGFGVDVVGPADPFSGVIAVLGTLWPGNPSFALVLLWLLALPLAVLGGWFAATRVTDRPGLRVFGGIAWALAPTFLTALIDARPAAVLLHLLLPWLFHAAVAAHRSWGAAGAASLLLAAVLACAPSLGPALALLWLLALVVVLAHGWFRGAVRLVWLLIPTAALFAPLVTWQLRRGQLWSVFADPGLIWSGPQVTADAAGRLTLASGFPTADLAGWIGLLPGLGAWAPVLLIPLALLALGAVAAPRWAAGATLLGVALVGFASAFAAVGVEVSFDGGTPVALWPGSGLSLAWIGIVGAALVTLDTFLRKSSVRAFAAVVAGAALVVCAVPALTAQHRGESLVADGPESTLPAYVAAEARGDREVATLVLTPQSDGSLATAVIWGTSETLGAQATIRTTAAEVLGEDVSELAVGITTTRDFDAAAELAERGIRFVLVDAAGSGGDDDPAQAFRIAAVTAVDQRAGFVKVRETDEGALWRLDAEPAARAEPSRAESATGSTIVLVQLLVLLAALLLAIPTRASRRAARAQSRIVGLSPQEIPLVRRERGAAKRDRGEEAVADEQPRPAADEAAAPEASASTDDARETPVDTPEHGTPVAGGADNVVTPETGEHDDAVPDDLPPAGVGMPDTTGTDSTGTDSAVMDAAATDSGSTDATDTPDTTSSTDGTEERA